MAKLIYDAGTSLDGYVADEAGNFEWAELGDDVHAYINSRESRVGTYLFGRKMYETMAVWETPDALGDLTPAARAYEPIWRAADKIVYSTTLQSVSSAKTRLLSRFDPDFVRELKAEATRDIAIGGPTLAAHAIRAGLVDEYDLLIAPVIAGGGTAYWPHGVSLRLELLDERRFDNGIVLVRYRTKR
jgi:dihydrofolate reductase